MAARLPELDLGLHLTLTSETTRMRWRPTSTTSRASGLIDDDGYMWPRVPALRSNASPEAVEEELETQIAAARDAGIRITHLDHHMGGAFVPEFARDHRQGCPPPSPTFLVPADPAGYAGVLDWAPADLEVLTRSARRPLWPMAGYP